MSSVTAPRRSQSDATRPPIIEKSAKSSESEIGAIHAYCAVYTKPEVAKAVLDGIGWTSAADLRNRRLLEPAAGDGAFLIAAIERLLESAKAHGFYSEVELADRMLAFEFEPRTAMVLAARVRRLLRASGLQPDVCDRLSRLWVRDEDFLNAKLDTGFTDVVGNPPYMRWSKLPPGLRVAYQESLSAHAARGDLCLAFVCKSVELLADTDARVAFLCADRWLKCAYGDAARIALRKKVRVAYHVEAHGLPVFAGTRDVTTYAAVTVLDTNAEGAGVVSRPADLAEFLQAVRRPILSKSRAEARRLLRAEGGALVAGAPIQDLLAVVMARHPKLAEMGVEVRCGMALGCAQAFVVDPDADIEPERLVPFVRSQDLTVSGVTAPTKRLINVWGDDGVLIGLDAWPRLAAHLAPWRLALKRRACVGDTRAWHRTIDRLHANLSAERVLVAGMARRSRLAMAGEGEQPSNAVYVLQSCEWPTTALFALLRSGVLDVFAEALAPTFSGGSRRFDGNLLRQVRIPLWSSLNADLRKALEVVDARRPVARPGLISDVLDLRAGAHRKAITDVLSATWGGDME